MRTTSAGLAAASVLVSGCASIVKGGSQDLVIDSAQGAAQFEVRDLKGGLSPISGTTPATITLSRGTGFFSGAEYEIEISRPGYQSTTRRIDSHVSGWYLGGNLVLGGLIGYFIVDPVTGAMWQLEPDELNVNLIPLADAVAAADPELEQWSQIAVAAEPPLALPIATTAGAEPPAVEAQATEPVAAEPAAVAPAVPVVPAVPAVPAVPDLAVAEPEHAPASAAVDPAPMSATPPVAAGVTMAMPRQTAVYPQPRVDGARIRMLPPGHELALESTLRNADGKWWFVRGEGVVGWILDAAVTP